MKDSDLYLIGRYLREELDKTELEAFTNKLQENKAFADEVKLQKEVMEAIADQKIVNLKRALNEVNIPSINTPKKKRKPFSVVQIKRLTAAAILVLLITISVIFRKSMDHPKSNQELFSEYYEPHNTDNNRNIVNTPNDNYQLALDTYNNQDYDEALVLLEKALADNPDEVYIQFLIAQCQMKTGDIQMALVSLKKVIDHGNNTFMDEALWYTALSHLKGDDLSKAKVVLQEIISDQSEFKQQAEELLEKII